MIKIDRSTSIYYKGGFARICVEIDLQKPLLPSYMIFGEERHIVFEGLHQICFNCGRYGHRKDKCPLAQKEVAGEENAPKNKDIPGGGDGRDSIEDEDGTKIGKVALSGGVAREDVRSKMEMEANPGGGSTIVTGDQDSDTCPYEKIKILRHDFRSPNSVADLKQDIKGNIFCTVKQNNGLEELVPGRGPDIKDLVLETNAFNGIIAIHLLESSHQFLHFQVTSSVGTSWFLTVVYASLNVVSRRSLRDHLVRLAIVIHGPWILGGDLNATLFFSERRSTAKFQSTVDRDFLRCLGNQTPHGYKILPNSL
ncbi:hypothetical protein K1719_032152 [Acacia pycnantha]|nr:hypothetical protein K1719_032152 [Acacia pycnantha]